MAEIYKFFNSAPGDPRFHEASDFADYLGSVLSSGILSADGTPTLQVSVETGTLKTILSPGNALIKGYQYKNTTPKTLAHTIPEVGYDRIDRIVLRWDARNSVRNILSHVKEGVPSVTPVAPDLQRDNFIYEISLAQIRVRKNTVQLLPADLIDERLNEELCGLVTWTPKVPTQQFQREWDEFMAGIVDEGFATVASVQAVDGKVDGVSQKLTTHEAEFALLKEEVENMELTAENVTTTQGPSVQETLDTLKLDTDNKIISVRNAIVSKGGVVAGSPPTAAQLVEGIEGLPNEKILRRFDADKLSITSIFRRDNHYVDEDHIISYAPIVNGFTAITTRYDGTIIKNENIQFPGMTTTFNIKRVNDEFMIASSTQSFIYITDLNGTIKVSIPSGQANSNRPHLYEPSLGIVIGSYGGDHMEVRNLSGTPVYSQYTGTSYLYGAGVSLIRLAKGTYMFARTVDTPYYYSIIKWNGTSWTYQAGSASSDTIIAVITNAIHLFGSKY